MSDVQYEPDIVLPEQRGPRGRSWYVLPENPPYRYWLEGAPERLHELVVKRDELIKDGDELDSEESIEYLRLRGKADFFFFAKYIMWFPWLEQRLHGRIAWAWSAPNGTVWTDHLGQKRKLLRFRMCVIPRSHLKSTLCTVSYAAWCLVRNPEERILIYAANDDLAQSFLAPIKLIFEGGGPTGELFKALYGEIIPDECDRGKKYKWSNSDLTIKRLGSYTDPSIKARGLGAKIVGSHFTKQLVDDTMVDQMPRSQVDKLNRYVQGLTPLYASTKTGERRLVGTPWGFWDPIAYVEKNWPNALVARLPFKDKVGRLIYKRADLEEIEQVMKADPFLYMCQYMCWPKDEGKKGFQSEWFKQFRMRNGYFYDVDEDGKETKKVAINECNTFILVDPASMEEPGSRTAGDNQAVTRKANDFAAWVVVCVSPDNTWYIPRVLRWRCNVHEFMAKTHDMVAAWNPKFVAIEQIAAQRLYYHLFVRDWKDGKPKFVLIPWPGGNASKPLRISGLVPFYANGFIRHRDVNVNDGTGAFNIAAGINALEGELLDYPNAEYDDASDALSAGLALCYAPGKEATSKVKDALRALIQEIDAPSKGTFEREEWEFWQKKQMKGIVTGDALLKGMPLDDGNDPLSGLFSTQDLEAIGI